MIKWLLTANQDDDASSHGNAGLACFVISSTVGALHSHAGYAQPSHRYNNAHNHEGAGCLEGTWRRGQDRVNPLVTVTSILILINGRYIGSRVWKDLTRSRY